ncbi:Zn-dependent dipeptidase, dipeptidase homolog [Arenibacter palladensis]|uniref:Zn-dependent dipeptidase, dipeptidase homolog n=1 Tax=Arenibacter palladensis TaxID=237373 RepID=A0A1M5DVX2_9FLAO|nr:dipeptidase [Arenibacter palladensis]SHF71188.1 Zn-dependent dipeptidase, dipeptidase homolog [Arenibacter palladensis]
MKKFLRYTLAIVLFLFFLATFIVSPILDKQMNLVEYNDPRQLGTEAKELYNSLEFIADLHCDALLWDRDLTKKLDYAHLDFPRMQQANMSLQAFTIVTKSPKGQNFKQNSADAFDKITMLNFVQGRLPDKWFSLYKRAVYQARALQDYQEKYAGKFLLVKSRQDLKDLIELKKTDPEVIGGFLGIEGAHCLEGNLDNLQNLYYEGVRMMAPTHFFDNELGGSAHGISGAGLTDFGREVIHEMNRLGVIIDLAHVSPKMIDEILDLTTRPVLVSHTGVKGTKDSPRNISDHHINRIAASGGLIGIGFFRGAIKGEIKHIVEAMKYVRDLVGIEHVALGSDFDGAATTPIDVTGLPFIVQELMNQGFSESEIRAIMGENVRRFLMGQLP